jgi:predicted dehydrogenase
LSSTTNNAVTDDARRITRRDLVKGAAWAAASAPLIVPSTVFGRGAPSNRLNVAMIGLGSQGRRMLTALQRLHVNVVALCDVDLMQMWRAKHAAGIPHAKPYSDYRRMLHLEKSIQAVVIATPDHWHMHLCRAAIAAGKHVYCEKPLAHTVGEARMLRDLVRGSSVVTQMGNQGSASDAFRRSVEVIEAGALGQIREVHAYIPGGRFPRGIDRPAGVAGVPRGFNWDFWIGPSPAQPYLAHLYHPFDWRGWYEFGGGQLGDFGCHSFNLPMRALKLTYPDRIEVSGKGFGKDSYIVSGEVRIHFPQRDSLAPVTLNWYDDMNPPTDVFKEVIACYGELPSGVLLVGESGSLFTSPHNTDGILKLAGDKQFVPVIRHEGVRGLPMGLPRVGSHQEEWVSACKGQGETYSHFESGGHLTEIIQAGVLALRLGRSIDWDGPRMRVAGMPEAEALIRPSYRTRYM